MKKSNKNNYSERNSKQYKRNSDFNFNQKNKNSSKKNNRYFMDSGNNNGIKNIYESDKKKNNFPSLKDRKSTNRFNLEVCIQ